MSQIYLQVQVTQKRGLKNTAETARKFEHVSIEKTKTYAELKNSMEDEDVCLQNARKNNFLVLELAAQRVKLRCGLRRQSRWSQTPDNTQQAKPGKPHGASLADSMCFTPQGEH